MAPRRVPLAFHNTQNLHGNGRVYQDNLLESQDMFDKSDDGIHLVHHNYLLDEDDEENNEGGNMKIAPLKSTLPTSQRSPHHRIPSAFSGKRSNVLRPSVGHGKAPIEDFGGPRGIPFHNAHSSHDNSIEESFIPEVGRGQKRTDKGFSTSPFDGHQDFLSISSHVPHLSSSTAQHHDKLRAQVPMARQSVALSPIQSGTSSEDSASDSDSESEDGRMTSHRASAPFLSIVESTGNHQNLIGSPKAPSRSSRPHFRAETLDEFDKVIGNTSSRPPKDLQISGNPFKHSGRQLRYPRVDNYQRKVSDGSSTDGKKRAGPEVSTSGDTLVGSAMGSFGVRKNTTQRATNVLLPSGQRMGRAVPTEGGIQLPDLTGMTSALASPVKDRVGVEHRLVEPEKMKAFHMQAVEDRQHEFSKLASYVRDLESGLRKTSERVESAEVVSKDCEKQVKALQNEWYSWKHNQEHGGVMHQNNDVIDDYDYKKHVASVNEHIAQLSRDFQQYRFHMDEMQKKTLKATQNKPWFSSPRKNSKDDEQYAIPEKFDFLTDQVDLVAHEIERLKAFVHTKDSPVMQTKSASSPIKSTKDKRHKMHSVGVGRSNPFVCKTSQTEGKVNSDHHFSGKDYHPESSNEDDENFQSARKRAEKVISSVGLSQYAHDVKYCTVCSGSSKPSARQPKRQERQHHSKKQEAKAKTAEEDREYEHLIFQILACAKPEGKRCALSAIGLYTELQQVQLLRKMLAEHMDDFFHYRLLYGEMADELKKFDPKMSSAHRRVLANHVTEAVEGLEQRAERVSLLYESVDEVQRFGD